MEFEDRAKNAIKAIPRGKVATYAQIAALAGNFRAARQVVRVLHSSSSRDRLPWHRVINSRGGISLKRGRGFEEQRRLLLKEGVRVSRLGRILGLRVSGDGQSRKIRFGAPTDEHAARIFGIAEQLLDPANDLLMDMRLRKKGFLGAVHTRSQHLGEHPVRRACSGNDSPKPRPRVGK